MNKIMRCALVLGLVLCLILCAALFVACDPKKDAKTTYTVTVTCQDDVDLTNVKVQLKDSNGEIAAEKALDQGKATFELSAAEYTVTLSGVPVGYLFKEATLNDTVKDCNLELQQGNVYTVTIKYKDVNDIFGNLITPAGSAEGVTVSLYEGQLADDNLSRLPTPPVLAASTMTDANGKAVFTLEGDIYTVVVSGLAAGQSINYRVGTDPKNWVNAYTVSTSAPSLNLPLKDPDPLGLQLKNPIPLKMGKNDLPLTPEILEPTQFSAIFCTFTPTETGTYTFTTEGSAKIIESNDPYAYMNEMIRGSGTFEMQLKAGQTVSLLCGVSALTNMHYTITIEKSA